MRRTLSTGFLLLILASCANIGEPLLIRDELVSTDTERSFRLDGLGEGLTLQMAAVSDEALSDAMSSDVLIQLDFTKKHHLLFRVRLNKDPCDRLLGYAIDLMEDEGASSRYVDNVVDLYAPLRVEYHFLGKREGKYRYRLIVNGNDIELPLLARPQHLSLKASIPLKLEYLGKRNEQMDEKI